MEIVSRTEPLALRKFDLFSMVQLDLAVNRTSSSYFCEEETLRRLKSLSNEGVDAEWG